MVYWQHEICLSQSTEYNKKAIIVFTDGLENTSLYIHDVTVTDSTYAVGLGTAQQISTPALTQLINGTGGYLLLSGSLSTAVDDYFWVSKYFSQILAGVTSNDIIVDPSGYIIAGQTIRIPFTLTSSDIKVMAILMTDIPIVQFAIEIPNHHVMGPAEAIARGATVITGTRMIYYRFRLPFKLDDKPIHTGW